MAGQPLSSSPTIKQLQLNQQQITDDVVTRLDGLTGDVADIKATVDQILDAVINGGGGLPSVPPVFTSLPSITTDGTPQIGETLIGNDGVVTGGFVSARRWLLGSTVLATTSALIPTQTGVHTFEVTASGDGGTTVQSTTVTVAVADQVGLQPNPAPPVPAPTALSAPWTLPLTQVGRQQRFTFKMPTAGISVNKRVLMGMNAAGTKGIGMFFVNDDHWSVFKIDGSGAIVETGYQFQPWYGGTPQNGHEYAMEFYAPDPGVADNSIPDSFVVMRMYDVTDPTTSLHNYTWAFLKNEANRPDFTDCAYMRGGGDNNVAFVGATGATNTPQSASYGAIPGSISPLTLTSETRSVSNDTLTVRTEMDYYKDTAPTGYDYVVNGTLRVSATILPESTKGHVVMTATFPKPAPGSPVRISYEDKDGSASVLGSSYTSPAVMTFGINFAPMGDDYHNSMLRDKVGTIRSHFSGNNYYLRAWTKTDPQLDKRNRPTLAAVQQICIDNQTSGIITSGPNASPSSVPDNDKNRGDGSGQGPAITAVAPRIKNGRRRAIWDGVPDHIYGADSYGVAQNVQTGTNGSKSWYDYTHNADLLRFATTIGSHDQNLMVWRMKVVNGTIAQNFEVIDIDAQGNPLNPGFFDAAYVNDNVIYQNHTIVGPRFMDVQKIIGASDRVFSSQHVTTGSDFGVDGGLSYPMCFDFLEQIGTGGHVTIPLQADESFIRAMAALGATWCARVKKRLGFSVANEMWNSDQPAWYYCRDLGQAMGITGDSPHDIVLKYMGYISEKVFRIITDEFSKVSGATPYLVRILCVQNDAPTNVNTSMQYASTTKDWIDMIQDAPYAAGSLGLQYPGDPSQITPQVVQNFVTDVLTNDAPPRFNRSAQIRDIATSYGKAHGTYEGFLENIQNYALLAALKQDAVQFPRLVNGLCDSYKSIVGGEYSGYQDNSLPWGFRGHVSQSADQTIGNLPPALGLKAWRDYIAAQPAI